MAKDLFGNSHDLITTLRKRYIAPPFSVLDASNINWKKRKRKWKRLGIQSEVGRDAKAYTCNNDSGRTDNSYFPKMETGTSIFDPVLCEIVYHWFSEEGNTVLDPFAGGSVRGIVAGALGRKYWGCDLSAKQIKANKIQADDIKVDIKPEWICGDSLETLEDAPDADFIFSCPPYGDLEVYSDDPRDLSNMEYHSFVINYKQIIHKACQRLKPNRFACFVVGDFRDKQGHYRDFVSKTIRGFKNAGLELYNEAVLVMSVSSASMRVTKQFSAGRKLCKTHQNVLVFCKGDWRKAVKSLSEIKV